MFRTLLSSIRSPVFLFSPLASLRQWYRTEDEIRNEHDRHFSVMGIEVRANTREVSSWRQPMLVPCGLGVIAFVVKEIRGLPHLLVRAMAQPGLVGTVQLGPTLQCRPENYAHLPDAGQPPFLHAVLSAPRGQIRYDSILSEEGGRFYHAENRYLVIEAGDDFAAEPPAGFCWITPRQLATLLRRSHYVSVEARTLLACLYSLCRADQ